MEALGPSDRKLLEAAEGWLGLGDWQQAESELKGIPPERGGHPDVLRLHWHVLAAAGKWVLAGQVARTLCTLLPENPSGWVCLAYAAHKLNHTGEARQVLLTVVDEFADQYSIRYDLACYACHLGRVGEAWHWLEKAMELPHSAKVDRMALRDPNLEPLWRAILRKQKGRDDASKKLLEQEVK